MCGEQPYSMPLRYFLAGSPPRVRGTATVYQVLSLFDGITPARAGNSPCNPFTMQQSRDHPRACGEQSKTLIFPWQAKGSPPRVRGTAQYYDVTNLQIRITPARAGNSCRQL